MLWIMHVFPHLNSDNRSSIRIYQRFYFWQQDFHPSVHCTHVRWQESNNQTKSLLFWSRGTVTEVLTHLWMRNPGVSQMETQFSPDQRKAKRVSAKMPAGKLVTRRDGKQAKAALNFLVYGWVRKRSSGIREIFRREHCHTDRRR